MVFATVTRARPGSKTIHTVERLDRSIYDLVCIE